MAFPCMNNYMLFTVILAVVRWNPQSAANQMPGEAGCADDAGCAGRAADTGNAGCKGESRDAGRTQIEKKVHP